MLIYRKSPFTGRTHSMDIDITEEQLVAWRMGELIQNVMPHLSPDEREFLMTGYNAEDWEKLFDILSS